MGRGFFAGLLWGVGLAGVGLATLSLTMPAPDLSGLADAPPQADPGAAAPRPVGAVPAPTNAAIKPAPSETKARAPEAGVAEVPAGSEFTRGLRDGPVHLPDVAAATTPRAGDPARPERARIEALSMAGEATRSPGLPDAGAQAATLPWASAPADEADPGLMLLRPGTALPTPQAFAPVAPAAPAQDGDPAVFGAPVAPPPQKKHAAGLPETPPQPPAGFPQGELAAVDAAPMVTAMSPRDLPMPPAEPSDMPTLPALASGGAPDSATKPPRGALMSSGSDAAPGDPASLSPAPKPEADVGLPKAETETATQAPTADLPAILAYGAPYDASDPRPRMAIVLIDEGTGTVDLTGLRRFPYPISIALDVTRPDARAAMQRYRDAGIEVLARAGLAAGDASDVAADVAGAATRWFQAVPEAVAVLEEAPGALQQGRAVSEALAARLGGTGQGLLLYPDGANTARKLAQREGVFARTLFRDFDGNGEAEAVIRRFLDYAALKAGEDGGVVMVGRLRPETVSALLVWGLAERASRVQLVPVSAVLTQPGQD